MEEATLRSGAGGRGAAHSAAQRTEPVDEADEAAPGLLAWLAGEGAQLAGLALAPSRALGCPGLHAAAPLPPGAALAHLPLRLVLTARRGLLRDAQACAAFLALRQPSPALALLLCLAHARSSASSASSSPWRAYALSLPAAVPSLLHGRARAAAVRRALAARGLAHLAPRVLAERRALREGCAAAAARAAPAHAAWATPAALRWAHAAFASRAMRLPSGEAAMVPLLDMANHDAASQLRFALAAAAGAPAAAAEPHPASAQALAALALLGASEAASAGATTLPSCVFQALLQAPAAAAAAAAPAPAPAAAAALPFPAARSAQQQSLALVLGRAPLAAGQELLINYGTAKPSFSFALLSGFVPRQPNRGDTCAVHFDGCSGALALGEGGGGAQGFVLTWAGLPSGVLAAARSVCGCSGSGSGSGSGAAPAPPRNALACDPELAAFMAEQGAQGAAVVQWLAGQCLQLSSALEAARRAPAAQVQAAEGGGRRRRRRRRRRAGRQRRGAAQRLRQQARQQRWSWLGRSQRPPARCCRRLRGSCSRTRAPTGSNRS